MGTGIKVCYNLDLGGQSEIQNAIIQNISSDPLSGKEGQVYFNTASNTLTIFQNNTWTPYLSVDGGTIKTNNTVTLGRDPTDDMEAVTKRYADSLAAATDAMVFKGTISGTGIIKSSDTTINSKNLTALTTYKIGWTFKVSSVGTITGIGAVEPNDTIYCIANYDTSYDSSDFACIQGNIDKASSAVAGIVMLNSSTSNTSTTVAATPNAVNSVYVIATSANNTAVNASMKANQAMTNATSAVTTAEQALSNATSSLSMAQTANNTATNALSKATSAESNASSAVTLATNANKTANNTMNTVTNLSSNVTTLTTTVNNAYNKANTAYDLATNASTYYYTTNPALTLSGGVCTWTVNHNLKCNFPTVTIYSISDRSIVLADTVSVNNTHLKASFISSTNISAGIYGIACSGKD